MKTDSVYFFSFFRPLFLPPKECEWILECKIPNLKINVKLRSQKIFKKVPAIILKQQFPISY